MAENIGRTFDPTSGRPIVVDPFHAELNSGDMWSIYQVNPALATGGIMYYEIRVSPDYEADVEGFEIFCTDLYVEVALIEDPTLTTGATAITPRNLKRASSKVANTVYKSNPTGISGGTIIDLFYVGGGTGVGATKSGGQLHSQLGWLLNPDTNYLLRLTNKASGNIILSTSLLISEHAV